MEGGGVFPLLLWTEESAVDVLETLKLPLPLTLLLPLTRMPLAMPFPLELLLLPLTRDSPALLEGSEGAGEACVLPAAAPAREDAGFE